MAVCFGLAALGMLFVAIHKGHGLAYVAAVGFGISAAAASLRLARARRGLGER